MLHNLTAKTLVKIDNESISAQHGLRLVGGGRLHHEAEDVLEGRDEVVEGRVEYVDESVEQEVGATQPDDVVQVEHGYVEAEQASVEARDQIAS